MNKAIFFDRDGVITKLIYNRKSKEYEPPHRTDDLKIIEHSIEALKNFQNQFKLFLVSNQPDYAKGKTSLENLKKVHEEFHKIMISNKINFTGYYYCYHHPDGTIPAYTIDCECRKPKNYFVKKAISEYKLDKGHSWFIGDRESDIECGKSSGIKTILIKNNIYNIKKEITSNFTVKNLNEALKIILNQFNDN